MADSLADQKLSDALLNAIKAWDRDWNVNLRDNEPYYDLLWRVQSVLNAP